MKRGILTLTLAVVVIGIGVVGLVPSVRSAFLDNVLNISSESTTTSSSFSASNSNEELGLIGEAPGELNVGDPAPNFRLKTVDGRMIELADYQGTKNVILNFWATWCPPCKAEMPHFQDVYEQHSDDLVVLGVDLMESKDTVQQFLKEEVDVSYPILMDPNGEVSQGYRLFTQPTTFFVNEQGKIAPIGGQPAKNGAFTPEELERRVAALLGKSGSSASSNGAESGSASPETSSSAVATKVKRGDLSGKYFSQRRVKEMGFDVDPTSVKYASTINLDQLMSGGPPPDGIPSIDAPRFQSVQSASQWLKSEDVVLGVQHNGEAKAYPIRILNHHEIVNDTIGGTPIAATYCPLCGSGVVFVRPELKGTRAEFGTSGRLYNSDLVMYDRVTGTFWSQLEGTPMVGPLVGEFGELQRLPNSMAKWATWKEAHPDARVLKRPTSAVAMGGEPPQTDNPQDARQVRDYGYNPYAGYEDRNSLMFPVATEDDRLAKKQRVSGVTLQDQAKAYLKSAVRETGVVNDFVGGVPVLAAWNPELGDVVVFKRKHPERPKPLAFEIQDGTLVDTTTGTSWSWDGKAQSGPLAEQNAQLERVTSTTTFWFAWAAFHPETELFAPKASSGSSSSSSSRSNSTTSTDQDAASSEAESNIANVEVKRGDFGWKYLTDYQAQEMGFDVNVENVRYAGWLDRESLRSGGQPPDGIPSIDTPRFETPQSASEWLKPDDVVLTVEHDGRTKAYPTRILNYHEIVNDTISGTPIAATFCPLCNSGVVFERPEFQGKRAEFGTTGRLYNSNLVMYDRVTGTFWEQITGRPMIGPLVGRSDPLERIASDMARWSTWKQHHPEAQVLARPTPDVAIGGSPPLGDKAGNAEFVRNYSKHPYADYVSSDYGTFGTLASDDRLVPKAKVSGLHIQDDTKAYKESAVKADRIVNDAVGDTPIVVVWDPKVDDVVVFKRTVPGRAQPLEFQVQDSQLVDRQTGSTWSWDGQAQTGPLATEDTELERVSASTMYWFAWAAFHPDTGLYAPQSDASPEPTD
ncbi:MAG: DUF3179 domain-containing (seleno)protein [Candidatus Bipolaricaulia bacterium]